MSRRMWIERVAEERAVAADLTRPSQGACDMAVRAKAGCRRDSDFGLLQLRYSLNHAQMRRCRHRRLSRRLRLTLGLLIYTQADGDL